MVPAVYRAANFVTRCVLLPIFGGRVNVYGIEFVPPEGPVVIASNHLNDADPGLIASRVPRRLVFMTKVELFRVPVLKQFLHAYGAFPVRRNQADLAALREANETLKQGLALVIFPEGMSAGIHARLRQAWPGAALVALRNDVPVVPVAVTGTQRLGLPWLFLRPAPRNRITVTFGPPFRLPQPERVNVEAARAGTDLIMGRIAALLPPEYRGYYGNDPSMQGEQAVSEIQQS